MTGLSAARAASFVAFALASSFASAATCYVNSAATGSNAGTSWTDAYTDLQSALLNYPTCLEVYVARGTYKPTATNDRTVSFNVKPGVLVYGGFNGSEAALGDRLLAANPTILSGDIGVGGDASDNSYHVVVMDATTSLITGGNTLSDFTIREGNASGSTNDQDKGGGFFCNGSGATHICSPELANLIFENNSAVDGGAVYLNGVNGGTSDPYMHDIVFRNNTATDVGGAMYNNGKTGASNPQVEQCAFIDNVAGVSAGAIYNDGTSGESSPLIRNSTFYENSANFGGAIVNSGTLGGHANPQLRYLTFTRNKTKFGAGGAIRNLGTGGDSAPSISGVIFWADEAATTPIEMQTQSPTTPFIEYSITTECPGGAFGCINVDPLLGPLQDNGGFSPTLKPEIGSPAIEAGNGVNCPPTDQRGIVRPQGSKCDIGAVELQPAEARRCYVNAAAVNNHNGLSWATAYLDLNSALPDTGCLEVWVAKGTYKPTGGFGRSTPFSLYPRKAVYGGFAGTETLRSQRNPAANETILSGDIGTVGVASDNSYHVVVIDGPAASAKFTGSTVLDGFTIQGGQADAGLGFNIGGGLLCNGQYGYECSPTLANLKFTGNWGQLGGGLAIISDEGTANPTLTSLTFTGNNAAQGGAIYIGTRLGGVSNPILTNAIFAGNSALDGGAIYIAGETGTCHPVITDVGFGSNSAGRGGAVYIRYSGPSFSHATFNDNLATDRGGAVGTLLDATAAPHFESVTFMGNVAPTGGAVDNSGGSPSFVNGSFLRNGDANTVAGGAMANEGSADDSSPLIDSSAFVGNQATLGGAIYNGAGGSGNVLAVIENATFWKNAATDGAAIYVTATNFHLGDATINNSTFAINPSTSGGDSIFVVNNGGYASAKASNSIFYVGTAPSTGEIHVGDGTVVAIDHSIITNYGCPAGAACNNISAQDPLLGVFQNYGGYTPTFMPYPISPARDTGANCTATDQRGVARPQGPQCDIGAIERRDTEDFLFNSGFEF